MMRHSRAGLWMLAALVIAAILLAFAAPGASPAAAQGARIISVTLAPDTATVGDRLMLTITIEHEPGASVSGPEFGADFGGLELVSIPDPIIDGRRTVLAYELTSFRAGRTTVPSQIITVRGDATDTTLTTEPADVLIESVLAAGDTELRPLKPQLEIEDASAPAGAQVLFIAVFAALTLLGYVLFRRAANILPPVPVRVDVPPPAPTPAEAARARLDVIGAGDLATSDVPEYYARIAATVREYLSARFDFPAYAMTRRELERDMQGRGLGRWPARLTANLLEQCDAAEFAGFAPGAERRRDDLAAAYEIVDLGEQAGKNDRPQGSEPIRYTGSEVGS
jgi:hypothetical protein